MRNGLTSRVGDVVGAYSQRAAAPEDFVPFAIAVVVVLVLWAAFRWRTVRPIEFRCSFCGESSASKPGITLLGQRKLRCSACHTRVIHPMPTRYLVVYLVLFGGGVLGLIGKLADNPDLRAQLFEGNAVVAFGGLGMLALVALTRDMLLRITIARGADVRNAPPRPDNVGGSGMARRPGLDSAKSASDNPASLGWVWVVVVLACVTSIAVIVIALRAGWRLA